jgi:ABC-type multidrug transport system fused ATPase/permease subunit
MKTGVLIASSVMSRVYVESCCSRGVRDDRHLKRIRQPISGVLTRNRISDEKHPRYGFGRKHRIRRRSFGWTRKAREKILEHISFSVRPGETIGIIGGTGSAKSTLVQLIPRLYDVTDGLIRVGGRDVRTYKMAELRKAVGMVLQKNVLFSGTIRDNLRWGDANATDEDVENA